MYNVLEDVNKFIDENVKDNFICVDMTMGNGHDTLHLAMLSSFVYSFDIQNIALDNTKKLLAKNNIKNVKLICDNHEYVDKYINENVDLFIYNLGYLPGGNKNITTNYKSTINSLTKALNILNQNGYVILVIYTGHDEGKESNKVNEFISSLNQNLYVCKKISYINQINNPPYAIIIKKR